MMEDLHDNFSVGDDVMCPQDHGRAIRGTVRNVTPASVTVDKSDGHSETYRRRKYGNAFKCRKRTETDQREEEYEKALEKWRLSAPTCTHVSIRYLYPARVRLAIDTYAETELEIGAIATDLENVRDWFSKRPEEPR